MALVFASPPRRGATCKANAAVITHSFHNARSSAERAGAVHNNLTQGHEAQIDGIRCCPAGPLRDRTLLQSNGDGWQLAQPLTDFSGDGTARIERVAVAKGVDST